MRTCYDCKFFLKDQHENLPYPLDFYACDSTNKKVADHIRILEGVEDKDLDFVITPKSVAQKCPGYQEENN